MKNNTVVLAAAVSMAAALDQPPPQRRRITSEDLKEPNTNGKFPKGYTPKYLKKFFFDEKGVAMNEIKIGTTAFTRTAYNITSARKKFAKWKAKKSW